MSERGKLGMTPSFTAGVPIDEAALSRMRAEEIEAFRQRRNRAFRELDIDWARAQVPRGPTGEMLSSYGLLVGLHKARYECTDMEPILRHQSRAWLTSRNFSRSKGFPWPDGNELPDDEGKVL